MTHPGGQVNFSGLSMNDARLAEEMSFNSFNFPGRVFFTPVYFGNRGVRFEDATFEGGDVVFSGETICKGDFKFKNVTVIKGDLRFQSVGFADNVSFENVNVQDGNIIFENVTVEAKNFEFTGVTCSGDISLTRSKLTCSNKITFNGLKAGRAVILDNTEFSTVPDLRNASIDRDVSMIEMTIDHPTSSHLRNSHMGNEYSDMYRKLKSLAIQANDHQQELEFFAMEERAKRGWQYGWFRYLPTCLYDGLSNFGRSIARPSAWLGGILIVSAILFRILGIPFPEASLLSAIHAFPFIPWSRATREKLICSPHGGDCQESLNIWIETVAYAESFFALPFIFLIGLALRNRFRL